MKEWLGGLWYRCKSNGRDRKAGDVVYEEIGELDLGPSMAAAVCGAIGVGERERKGKRRWWVCVCSSVAFTWQRGEEGPDCGAQAAKMAP